MSNIGQLVREHFRDQAASFDSLYGAGSEGEGSVQRLLRSMMFARRDAAVAAVKERNRPSVLDIGCGSCRVGELLLEAGAARYLGIDFSEPMIQLATERLQRFGDKVELRVGDALQVPLEQKFDVVLALGFFDYIEDPVPFARKMFSACGDVAIASFPRWDWVKGPLRRLRYQGLNDCPIFDYTARELEFLFKAAGFGRIVLDVQRSAILMRAFVT